MAWHDAFTAIFRGLYKTEDKPKQLTHGANWNSPYGQRPPYSPAKALEAYAAHGYTNAAVSRCSQDIAALPIKLIRGKGKNAEVVDDHPVLDLFETPSTQSDGYLFLEQLCTDLILSGNAYVILLGPGAAPTSIMRIHPQEIQIITDQNGISGYKYTTGGEAIVYPTERIIHVRQASYAKGPQQDYGVGCVQPLSREIDADINAMTLASQASAKGRPDIILSPTDPADIWGHERRKEILNQYTGLAKNGGCLVLSGQMAIESLKLSPREMEYEKSRVFARESISSVVGIPGAVLGLPTANYATLLGQTQIYWANQKKRAKRFEIMFTKIARLFDSSLSVEFDYSDIAALQDVRDQQLARIQQHILNGMDVAAAYQYEGLGSAPIDPDAVAETPEDLVEFDDPDELADLDEDEERAILELFPVEKKKSDHQELIDRVWHDFIEKQHGPTERKFDRQVKAYLKAAAKRYAKRLRDEQPKKRVFKNMQTGTVEKAVIVDWTALLAIFDEKRFLMRALGVTWKKVWTSSGVDELRKIFRLARTPKPEEIIGGWDDYSAGFAEGAGSYVDKMLDEITKTTAKNVKKLVEKGLNEGLPIKEIAKSIQDDHTFDAARATLIARTEATRVHGASTLASMRDAKSFGVNVRKAWIANRDDHTREWHTQLLEKYGRKDQAIEPEEDFVIDAIDEKGALFGTFQGQNPGSFGDPAMDCNCRCTIKPVVIRK